MNMVYGQHSGFRKTMSQTINPCINNQTNEQNIMKGFLFTHSTLIIYAHKESHYRKRNNICTMYCPPDNESK